jgi:phosphate-selective porin OprO and OprP
MYRTGWTGLLAGVSSFALVGAVQAAGSDEALRQIEELRRQNEALAAKVARLEEVAGSEGAWLTEERATQIRGLVQDVLSDADARASLQADGATAGWNKGFFLASPDGNFKLNIKGQAQFRWAANFRDIPDSVTGQTERNYGFENRRTKLTFSGHIIDPSLTFEIKPIFNRSSVSISGGDQTLSGRDVNGSIEDIFIQKSFGNGLSIRAGQFKAPFLREELVSSAAQLAVERSVVTDTFSTKFSQGVQLEWEQDAFRVMAFYGDGLRANRVGPTTGSGAMSDYGGAYLTDFQTNDTDWAFAGRAELKLAGQWKQFRDMTSFRGEEFGMLLGLGAMGQNLRPNNANSAGVEDMFGLTADVSVDFGGANLFAAGVYRQVGLNADRATRGGGAEDSLSQWGFVVQGGFFVIDDLELFGRYEYGDTDSDQFRTANLLANGETASVVTIGANWYPLGYKNTGLKWTTDVGFALDSIVDFNSSGGNWLSDQTGTGAPTSDGQFVIRSQIQLLF